MGTPTPKQEGAICPHLGLHHDPATCALVPSRRHYCHHAQPPSPVALRIQEQYCLNRFRSCPVYARSEPAPLPPEMRARKGRAPAFRLSGAQILILLLVFLGIIALSLYLLR